MAIDLNKKFLYFNKDSTSGEMDEALCFPVSSFIGAETQSAAIIDLYFKGSKGVDATQVRVVLESDFIDVKSFYKKLVDQINFGEIAFIKVNDYAERSTHQSDITFAMTGDIAPVFTLQDSDVSGGVTADPFSTTVIKVLPNQFVINDDAGRPLFVEDDTSNTLGVRCFGTTDEMYAWQKLPSGYKATHVQVHASASTSSAVTVGSYNYQTGADNAVSQTSGDLNANIDITDIPSSATQDLFIRVAPASGSTIIFGATITIATI